MRAPFQAKKDGHSRPRCSGNVLAMAALASCLLSGCAGSRNRTAGDPLLGDFMPQRLKARSSPPANSPTARAGSKSEPIPRLDLSSSNAEYAQGDPLRGDLAINRQVVEQRQDPWQAQLRNGVNTQDPMVRRLPREEQKPTPQIVPATPQSRPTTSWQGPGDINPKAYDDYFRSIQTSAANEAARLQDGVQQLQQAGMQQLDAAQQEANVQIANVQNNAKYLRDDVAAAASQVRENTWNPLAARLDSLRNAAANEFTKLKYGAQNWQENIAATAAQLRDNTLNAFGSKAEPIRNAAVTPLTPLPQWEKGEGLNATPTMQDYVAVQKTQLLDQLQADLKSRGVLWQQQVTVPEGVRFTCIVPRRDGGGNRTYEATASDSVSALRAVLQQIDQAR